MPTPYADPVLETLCLPLSQGDIRPPEDGQILFLRARFGADLAALSSEGWPKDLWLCDQSFKPDHDALDRAGFTLRDSLTPDIDDRRYRLVVVLPPRSRDESRALLARAVTSVRDGGIILGCVSNLEGAKTVEGDLKALCGHITSLPKNKCRAFWATAGADVDHDLVRAWSELDAPVEIEDGLISRPGLFAWDRIDAGSRLLVEHLPTLSGRGADLGAGTGYLSREVLRRNAGVTHISLFEAEARALPLAQRNLAAFADRFEGHWHDVTRGVTGPFDFIVSNPPFHTDRADRNDLGQAFIRAASGALGKGGSFWMVANRHLPYEATLKATFRSVITVTEMGPYKVFKGMK